MKRAAVRVRRARPATGQFEPLLWTFDQALHRMLPGATSQILVPSGWRCWTKPRKALPIDDAVDELLKRPRPPRIDKSDLRYDRMLADGCPYFHARQSVALAIDFATRAHAEWPERSSTSKDLLSRYRTSLEAIYKAIPDLINLSQQIQSLADHPLATPVLVGGEKIVSAAQQLSWAIENTDFAVDYHHYQWVNNQPDIWRIEFVAALANSWKQITGRPAANSDPFREFVMAAWNSASGSEEDVTFEQAIRHIVEARSHPAYRIQKKPRSKTA
jgi:hypothetical protein